MERGEYSNDLMFISFNAAAKAALRRKKGYEKNLEQTTAQVTQLEQQIYSIEAANINQETLNAMKTAGAAMSQIHKGLTIDKVDETMYVLCVYLYMEYRFIPNFYSTGTNSENSTNSARKLLKPLQQILLEKYPTRRNSKKNWRVWSKRLWISVCSLRDMCLLRIKSVRCLLRQRVNVSFSNSLLSCYYMIIARFFLLTWTLLWDLLYIAARAEEEDEEAELEKLRAEMAMG